MIPGTAYTTIAFETSHNEFKERVQQWFENRLRKDVPEGYCSTTAVNITTSPVDKLSMLDSAKPGYSSTLPQRVSTKPDLEGFIQGVTTSSRFHLNQLSSSLSTNPEATPLFKVSDRKSDPLELRQQLKSASSSRPVLSKSHKSRRSSNYSSASRLEEARIKLELARLTKLQNEERLREEKAEAELKTEMERQRAEIERELQRRKINAEDERRIKVAELEAALLQQGMDGQCSPDGSQCGDRPYIRFAFSSHNTPS